MDRYNYQRERKISHSSNPSFSSTLLDAIYRSIDQGEEEIVLYKETMRKKQSSNTENFQRACMIEKWMEHKVSDKVVVRRKSAADFERKSRNLMNSSSSSSDSSCGGVFSSSETESVYNNGVNSSGSSYCYGLNRPKPIRTSLSTPHPEKFSKNQAKELNSYGDFGYNRPHVEINFAPKTKNEGGFVKTKSKALKIYGDLKKVKQPISPGGRLASFLNSIFTAGNAKKPKVSSNSANASSTCSSASSFSRSCLSKSTPKSGSNGIKRSVRFYPVSVIVDEDCQPCGHKNLYEEQKPNLESVKNTRNSINEELKFYAMEKNRRVEEAAKDLLWNYQRNSQIKKMEIFNDEEDDDDAASCASSDLFELDNLSAIEIDSTRYHEELPVYETTHLDTNRAIANGLIL